MAARNDSANFSTHFGWNPRLSWHELCRTHLLPNCIHRLPINNHSRELCSLDQNQRTKTQNSAESFKHLACLLKTCELSLAAGTRNLGPGRSTLFKAVWLQVCHGETPQAGESAVPPNFIDCLRLRSLSDFGLAMSLSLCLESRTQGLSASLPACAPASVMSPLRSFLYTSAS